MELYNRISDKLRFICSSERHWAHAESYEEYNQRKMASFDYHLIESSRRAIVRPVSFWGGNQKEDYTVDLPDLYWAHINSARIIGQSCVVLTADNVMLYDMLRYKDKYHANMTDGGLFLLGGFPWHIGRSYMYNHSKDCLDVLECGISLCNRMSNNYYHFMFEVASKFYVLKKTDIAKNVPLLVDEAVLNIPQLKYVIDLLNSDNRKIIPIARNKCYEVQSLYTLSCPNIVTPNTDLAKGYLTEGFAFYSQALEYIKKQVRDVCEAESEVLSYERIFLSRKNCAKRSCNEEELMPVLEKHGVKVVYTDSLSIVEQCRIFGSAKIIIGGTGAAFTNLLYCKPGSAAIIFMPIADNVTCFSSLASALGIDTVFIKNTDKEHAIHKQFYTISPTELDDCITHINSKQND